MSARKFIEHMRAAWDEIATARKIIRHIGRGEGRTAIVGTVAESHARAAIGHSVEAAACISPEAGRRVADASARALADAHRRVAARHEDAHAYGLDESGAAACAAEGTGGRVVDVAARGADEERLHAGERGTRAPSGPVAHVNREWVERQLRRVDEHPRCACGEQATHEETLDGRHVRYQCAACAGDCAGPRVLPPHGAVPSKARLLN